MKKWECSVCGYIHEGETPPDVCPVCGADKDKFVEIVEPETEADHADREQIVPAEDTPAEAPASPPRAPQTSLTILDQVSHLILENHLHPISVHSPNGIVPVAAIFLILAALFQSTSLNTAAYYNMIVVLLCMPVVLVTGYTTWQKKYDGVQTSVFKIKIIAGSIATVSLLLLIIWRTLQPEVLDSSPGRWIFLLLMLLVLGSVGIAGHLGGKLVFASKQ